MNCRAFLASSALVLAAVVGIVGCRRHTEPERTLTIGVVLPLTGRASDQGKDILSGIELAQEEINRERTLGQPRLELAVEDDMGDPKSGVSALEKLILTKRPPAVIGPIASSVMLAMIPIAEREKVVLLSPAASSPKISNSGKYIFRLSLLAPPQVEALAEYAHRKLNAMRAAILYGNDETGVSYRDAFRDAFKAKGGEIVYEQTFDRSDADFRIQLTKLKDAGAEVCFVPSIPQTIGLILKQAKELGVGIQFLGNYGAEGESLLTTAGDAAEGFIYTSIPISDQFAAVFRAKTGHAPTIGAPLGYDALRVIWTSLQAQKPGSSFPDVIRGVRDHAGATGRTSMTPAGDAEKEVVIKSVTKGAFRIMEIK